VADDFVDRMLATLFSSESYGMVSCTTIAPSISGGPAKVVDQGFDVLDGERDGADRHFLVRRHAGFRSDDGRIHETVVIDAGTAHCSLMPLALATDAGVRAEFGHSHEAPDTTRDDLEILRARILRISRSLSTISIADVNTGGESLREAVRQSFHQMKRATVLWEERALRRYADAQHDALSPKAAADDNALASKVASASIDVQLRFHTEKIETMMLMIKRPQGADSMDALAWDMSFKLLQREYLTVGTNVTARFDSLYLPRAVQDRLRNGTVLHRTSYPVYGQLRRLWGRTVAKLYSGNDDAEYPLKVMWDGFCCGCCGFASEIAHFVYPMHSKRRIRLTMAPSCFCSGYPAAISDTLDRLHANVYRYADNAPRSEIIVWIAHTDPTNYNNPILQQRKPDYFIGRSMYEFTKVPRTWIQGTAIANELWVPGKWVRDMLVANGVDHRKMYIMPEGIDTWFFDPALRGKVSLPLDKHNSTWRRWCNRPGREGSYNFFSNFKWEPRKGWESLFSAYGDAFKKDEPVSLYVLTYVFGRDLDIFNVSYIQEQLQGHLASQGRTVDDLPHFCVIADLLSEEDLGDFYNSADAFVLPTRGEGWGLPTIQAMALGKPTISTAWGGQMEFMTQDTSFLIDLDGVEEIPVDSIYGFELGKKWATPSTRHLSELMRYVTREREHAAEVGRRAREHIVKHFSEEAVAALADKRISEIRAWLKHLRRAK
jgi:glycosyltransferase involved in cell wall biosynthesis